MKFSEVLEEYLAARDALQCETKKASRNDNTIDTAKNSMTYWGNVLDKFFPDEDSPMDDGCKHVW